MNGYCLQRRVISSFRRFSTSPMRIIKYISEWIDRESIYNERPWRAAELCLLSEI